MEALQQTSHKLAEAMYQQASAQQGGGPQQPGPDAGGAHTGGRPEDDVVDADFEEVKDNRK